MVTPQSPTLEEAIARVERMIRTRAPIEWTEGPRDLPRRRTQGGEEAAALRVVLEAARDGQRWRELRNPEGFVLGLENEARLFDMIETGGGGRIDALTARKWAETFRAIRGIILRPAEPVTPSAEVPGE